MKFGITIKPSMAALHDNIEPEVIPFSPSILKKDAALLDRLVHLWLMLDAEEAKYDAKYGLFFDDPIDLTDLFRKRLLTRSGYYLKYNDEVCGFAIVMDSEYKNAYWLSTLIIDTKYRGKGFGSLFVKTIFELNKPKRAILRVSMNNPAGLALYKKCGFEPISQVMMKPK